MPSNQPDPRMVQWQMRFENVSRSLSEPRRQNETDQQFKVRQVTAAQALKDLQMSKPTGPTPAGQGTQGTANQPSPSGGGMLDGLYGFISKKLSGN